MELAGRIGVDAGLCWIGDPCYVIHKLPKPVIEHIKRLTEHISGFLNSAPEDYDPIAWKHRIEKDIAKTAEILREYDQAHEEVGDNWKEFCGKLHQDQGHTSFGNTGACTSTGWGDGCYPVYVRRSKEGRVSEVVVRFMEEEEDDE